MREYLPLGSVIVVEGSVRKSIIVARGIIVNIEGKSCYYDYGICSYPEGMINTKLAYLNQEAVAEVISRGYTDESEQSICEAMEKASIDSIGSQKA